MNPTEIADALEAIASQPYDPEEFPYAFGLATGLDPTTVTKLRPGARSLNRSKLPGGVLMNKKFHFAPAEPGEVDAVLELLRVQKANDKHKPAVLIATDGETLAAEHLATGETHRCAFADLHRHFGFFLPAAGMTRFKAAEENEVDVRATGKLAKLYDALLKKNPDWKSEARRHELNQFMTRLIFCLFAEDVGIFPKDQFSRLITNHAGERGAEAHIAIVQAFTAMARPASERGALPDWAHAFEYVNGGLFAGVIDCPVFDPIAWGYFTDAARLDWKEINPDIFGSMIQSVADASMRGELGMHYTSVPNILKVLGPLFLDDLDAEIEAAWDNAAGLEKVLKRLGRIRVFDPACGSGNFLVIAYRELRKREMTILDRIKALKGEGQTRLWSSISLANFHGIEIADFAAETAKLALFIAEYQSNAAMAELFGGTASALPLRDGGHIVCDNALRVDWDTVCPPPQGDEEVFIAGNPPFLGKAQQEAHQKADKDALFGDLGTNYKAFDYVVGWFYKAGQYIAGRNAQAALVATNSIAQGDAASTVWSLILGETREIGFAHRTFKWRNNAAANAAVMCVIVGIRNRSNAPKRLFDGELTAETGHINSYLLAMPETDIRRTSSSCFGLPEMQFGNMPYDAGHLLLNPEERDTIINAYPQAAQFIRRFMGSQEVVKGIERYCIWIDDSDLSEALQIRPIAESIEATRVARLDMKDKAGKALAERPHQFREHYAPSRSAILVPSVSSERRPYLPVAYYGADVIASNLNFALYDAPEWCLAIIASRLHLVWIGTVCGKLKSDFRYSNTLGWNTFPVPRFTEAQLEALNESARAILKTRYLHHPKTIAQLYDPDKMPEDLREVHRRNDELLESMYIGRPFRNDTERLEKLFKLYAARVAKLKAEGKSKPRAKAKTKTKSKTRGAA
ncbi:MAG: lactate dehydrogenase [Pusillimonas sp.]|nr:lactate dehydrogenase [Pusillimonas sp.]|tara:strand:- start:1243 stop:3987 length:2745 start_codon:yes stop_codon:yes gene_type:complete